MIDFSKIKSKKEVGKCFDYAILPKQTTEQTIRDCCKEAIKYKCKAFCFSSSYWTPIVACLLYTSYRKQRERVHLIYLS